MESGCLDGVLVAKLCLVWGLFQGVLVGVFTYV
jgi:hypothetical protein